MSPIRRLWGRVGYAVDRYVGRAVGGVAIALDERPRELSRRADRRPALRSHPTSERTFAVYTFVTDDEQYEAMRRSFAGAGLEPPLATFVKLAGSTRAEGGCEPFAAIRRFATTASREYSVLCHQDVRLDQGAGAAELLAALAHLDELDAAWTVAGNAGGTSDLRIVRRLVDPYGVSTSDSLPIEVVSLDENFLVFNPHRAPRCSPGLAGFHFYGADVCLNAITEGGSAYVIDFPLTHLSAGTFDETYYELRQRFCDVWNPHHRFLYVTTTTDLVFISRSAVLRRLFGSPKVIEWVRAAAPRSPVRQAHPLG